MNWPEMLKDRWKAAVLLVLGMFLARSEPWLVVLFYGLLLFTLLLWRRNPRDPEFIMLAVAFAVRLLLLYIRTRSEFIHLTQLQLDDFSEYEVPIFKLAQMYQAGEYDQALSVIGSYRIYQVLWAIPYAVFGRIPLLLNLTNAFLSVLTVLYVYRIARYLFGETAGRAAGWVYTFWPSVIFTSLSMSRDALAVFLVVFCFWQYLNLLEHPKAVGRWLGLGAGWALLFLLRITTSLAMAGLALGPLVVFFQKVKWPAYMKLSLLAGGAVLLILAGGRALYEDAGIVKLSYQSLLQGRRAWGGSAYLGDISLTTPFDALKYSVLGGLHFFFGPFLWELKKPSLILTFLGSSLPIIVFFLLSWEGWRQVKRRSSMLTWSMAAFLGLVWLVYGFFEGNYGAALRHRDQFVWLFVVLGSPELLKLMSQVTRRKEHQSKAA